MALLMVVMVDSLVRWSAVLRGRRAMVQSPGHALPEVAAL
jgi:hypothetical protein